MAERLVEMPERKGTYPWHDWSDGSVWKITRGEDFSAKLESMRTQLYGRARDMGKVLELADIDKKAGTIIFRMKDKEGGGS